MSDSEERMHILEMIENGKITAQQGLQLLEALNESDSPGEEPDAPQPSTGEAPAFLITEPGTRSGGVPSPEPTSQMKDDPQAEPIERELPKIGSLPPEAAKWRRFWMIPLWIGVGITVLSGYWMYRAQVASSVGWMICASMPLILGVLVLALAWQSRTAPWLHLRVQQPEGESPRRIAFSFPIPVGPTAWFLRTFGHRIQGLKETSVDEIILALGTSTSPDNPLYIQVDEGDDEEKVEIYIG